ncbi:MAG TPA: anthranilate phosphoribosyltransferase, partial [Gordonia sp. (in: high G+C Gram-positive bacteria)]|nr:anthranilate phosphoribosyltransferase [Gordonia sp. (in: high G+C Gram-positive bacteria)]
VLLNAAGAIVAFEQTEPFTEETFAGALADARDRAAVVVDSGASRDVLDRWVALSTELGAAKN